MDKRIEIFGRRGDGSDMAEAFLTLADIPYTFISLDYDKPGPDRERLLAVNILGQVPTLRFPDGKILSESLAVLAYAQGVNPSARLIPEDKNLQRDFWRFATMLVAAIYPTFTYGDNPNQWVGEEAGPNLRKSTDERRKKLWHFFEKNAGEPYFLGKEMSAIDVYIKVMLNWRPGKEWLEKETPKLAAIRRRMEDDPRLRKYETP